MSALEQARAHLEAGEYQQARDAAMQALADQPDDAELLRVAGRAGVELGEDDAVNQLQKLVDLRPDEAEGWRDLGDALATEGRTDEANTAFQKVVELDPGNEAALTALGHTAYAAGRGEEAVSYLSQVADRAPGASSAHISLVDMYRAMGKHEEALEQASRLAEAAPDDVLARLDVAELSRDTGKLDEAAEAFEALREVLDAPEEEVAALHGLIQVELARGDTARAHELARQAVAIDPVGRSAGVLAHLEVEMGADPMAEEPRDASAAAIAAQGVPPSREEVDAALRASLEELRRLHAESRGLTAEDVIG